MAAWSDGYFTEIQYTGHYYPEMAPGFLAFACLRQGVRPPALAQDAAYLELGCGQGFGLNLLAAANPGMDFWGVDFHPGQIDNAERQAKAAGLSNVTFEDLSFEQVLALPPGRAPKFDVIALHGVFSWISADNRGFVVQILDRLLKPGGMVYVSYNCLPGWATLAPLQRFVAEHVARAPGDPQVQVMAALRAAQQMAEGGAGYFKSVPSLKQRIAEALKQTPAYLVHEYLNAHSQPLFHADVAEALEGAKLSFAASANIADDLVHLTAPAALQPLIQNTQDRTWKETLLDYASAKPFRRDIFVRGRNGLSRLERDALLDETRFTLLIAPGAESFEFQIPIGQITGQREIYQPIIDALAEGPRNYRELSGLPALAGARDGAVLQALTLLVGGRQIHPVSPSDGGAGQAMAFNRSIFDRLPLGEVPSQLAAATAGTAVRVDFAELVALKAVAETKNEIAAAREAWPVMARTGRRLLKGGQILQDQAANEAELAERIKAFKANRLPMLRALGVI